MLVISVGDKIIQVTKIRIITSSLRVLKIKILSNGEGSVYGIYSMHLDYLEYTNIVIIFFSSNNKSFDPTPE